MGKILGAGGGVTIPGQDIYAVDTVQRQRLGTRVVRGDCVYKYAKCVGTAITKTSMIAHTLWYQHFEGGLTTSTVAGVNTLTITLGGTHGELGDGEIAVHELEGGRILLTDGTWSENVTMGIRDNTAGSSGDVITITVDGEIPVARTAAHVVAIMGNMYRVTGIRGSGGNKPHIGVPMRICALGSYLWLQTWGPCWVAPGTEVGEAADNRNVYIKGDGGLTDNASPELQYAGYVLTSSSTGTQGTPFVYLMCSR